MKDTIIPVTIIAATAAVAIVIAKDGKDDDKRDAKNLMGNMFWALHWIK